MFEIKLADKVDKNGKVIPGRTESFEHGYQMSDFYERQAPVKPRKKRSKANIEGRKKKATLHRQKKEAKE